MSSIKTEKRFEGHIIDHNNCDKSHIFTNIVVKIVIPTFGWTLYKYLVGNLVTV